MSESDLDAKRNEAGRAVDQKLLDACIHCGLCLPACPTYLATGRETESPRGRIYLINLWQKSASDPDPRMIEHIDSCLGCLGCQTVCPSGVEYGSILNQARPDLAKSRPGWQRRLNQLLFEKLLCDDGALIFLTGLLRFWQGMRGRIWLNRLAKITFLPFVGKLARLESFLPPIPKFVPLPKQSWNVGGKQGVAQFFKGCVMDVFYGPANHAAVRLLRAQSQIVEVPEQTCCGALAFHAGELDIAIELAKRNIAAFEKKEGPIVVTSAGCGAMLKEYGELLANDTSFKERAEQFVSRVKDISEFLISHDFPTHVRQRARAIAPSVAYHAACHLAHAQKVREQPEKLLKQLQEDIELAGSKAGASSFQLVPLLDAEHCCGSAGIFNILHPQLSLKVLEAKMARLKESGASCVVTGNPGCLMQLAAGARQAGETVRVMHLVELLDQAYDLLRKDD